MANRSAPKIDATPDYFAYGKLQVHELAVADAMSDGRLSHHERAILERLGVSLGISEEDASPLERGLGMHPG